MSANEIKALKEKIKESKQTVKNQRQLLKKAKLQVVYQKLLLKQKEFEKYLATNKIPKNERGRNKSLCFGYSRLFAKEIFLLKLKFENVINTDIHDYWIVRLLRLIYNVNDIRSCIKEEDILPLNPFVSEEEFGKIDYRNFYPLISEIFTDKKLMEIISKIEDVLENNAYSDDKTIWHLKYLFNLEERVKYFSPELNFAVDIENHCRAEKKGKEYGLSYQTSLKLDLSLYHTGWFKEYVLFLEGKIDPDIHTELYLTYCQ